MSAVGIAVVGALAVMAFQVVVALRSISAEIARYEPRFPSPNEAALGQRRVGSE